METTLSAELGKIKFEVFDCGVPDRALLVGSGVKVPDKKELFTHFYYPCGFTGMSSKTSCI